MLKRLSTMLLVFITISSLIGENAMANPVATINGVGVYSDKQVSAITNSRIDFADGSWCDVATGRVVSRGAGYISIGSPAGIEESTKITLGPKHFTAESLDVSDVEADVTISVINGKQMTVTIEGPQSEVEAISTRLKGITLAVQGERLSATRHGSNDFFSNSISFGNVTIGGNNISISSKRGSATKIVIGVPVGSAVKVAGISGNTIIGNTRGSLQAIAQGSSDIRVGEVADATLSVQGSSDIRVANVTGNLTMNVEGSGEIRVKNGQVGLLSVHVMGNGDARFDGVAMNANLSLKGSGDIDVAHVDNKPSRSLKGSGDIRVGNW